jgi:hypothetical protein
MKEEEFKRMFPDLYKIWETWDVEYNHPLKDEIIDLMIDVKNAVIESIKEEHTETVSRPTTLAALLAGLGFKGTLIREQPFFNSNVSDKPVGSFQEILKID